MKQFCLLFFLLMSPSAVADSFRIALPDEDYPPYHFVDTQHKGILNELLVLFSEASEVDIEYIFAPEKRSAKMLQQGYVDARMESEVWLIGDESYYWSQEIAIVEDVLVVSHGTKLIDFKELNSLKDGILLGRFGYVYPKYELLVNSNVLHRENFYSDLDILQSLYSDTPMSKRFTIMSRDVVNWYIKKHPHLSQLVISDFNVGKAPLQLQFSYTPKGRKLVREFNLFLKELKESKELASIISRYQ
ncbi:MULTISPECIES: ABC transporter substrate-binding protein [unclassified Pseudoalteromonas]|uniref:substrate-binding periplasmic protein n=1 Tax=unclassified Pseudoalteromonas TaxID=194690 RepID=UPI0014614DF4|nr:transporter substrate-binding domain-containing protein [Pseudoalteromonas sp. NEC-BIFX-2020_015]NMR27257.1 transporter substrate-binding domain-containing protein [Pseudoalteromonas sp. NEC-BIFX-2020_015]